MECQLEKLTVHYQQRGKGRPILILHGWSGNSRRDMNYLEPTFEKRSGWQRFYLDLPGHGQTPGADWIEGMDQFLEVVLEFTQKVLPGQRFALVGTSSSAYLARGVVYRRADLLEGLMLKVPMIYPDDDQRDTPAATVLLEDPAFMASLSPEEAENYSRWMTVQKRSYYEALQGLAEGVTAYGPGDIDFRELIRDDPARYGFSFKVDELPEPFTRPTLIVCGRQDTVVGYRDAWSLMNLYPRATFAVLDRSHHPIPVDERALFDSLVNDWLDRIEESSV
jgi:pimeloyl-ACP methyl ester carboxylesterase